ncbi:hypothetical protein [Streptantibioticus ferralitis]|uniref:Fido domain-containing protein n=1 Tax=Streptantibioticus ferralitis TaxID=236510 RepID=A0ABT5Z2M5_9ACTN|nr:hypothetical protein [Streptantibioticus ferralitis]MDF2258071.1 hypothetical protein [Streptantibioticus ferralitis]
MSPETAERHAFERFANEPYYPYCEEAATRAAALLHSMSLLEPFEDGNAAVGAACARMYLEESGEPISPPAGAMAELVRGIRSHKTDLRGAALTLRGRAA